jgi:hypothetical protein
MRHRRYSRYAWCVRRCPRALRPIREPVKKHTVSIIANTDTITKITKITKKNQKKPKKNEKKTHQATFPAPGEDPSEGLVSRADVLLPFVRREVRRDERHALPAVAEFDSNHQTSFISNRAQYPRGLVPDSDFGD